MGFPNETDEDFNALVDFVQEIKFDHLGVFTYSQEEGTSSAEMTKQIDEEIKNQRYEKIMEIQQKISLENNSKRLNQKSYGLIVGYDEEQNAYLIRSGFNAPDDIDGNIFAFAENEYNLGDKVYFEIIDYNEYDLFAKIIE